MSFQYRKAANFYIFNLLRWRGWPKNKIPDTPSLSFTCLLGLLGLQVQTDSGWIRYDENAQTTIKAACAKGREEWALAKKIHHAIHLVSLHHLKREVFVCVRRMNHKILWLSLDVTGGPHNSRMIISSNDISNHQEDDIVFIFILFSRNLYICMCASQCTSFWIYQRFCPISLDWYLHTGS